MHVLLGERARESADPKVGGWVGVCGKRKGGRGRGSGRTRKGKKFGVESREGEWGEGGGPTPLGSAHVFGVLTDTHQCVLAETPMYWKESERNG